MHLKKSAFVQMYISSLFQCICWMVNVLKFLTCYSIVCGLNFAFYAAFP